MNKQSKTKVKLEIKNRLTNMQFPLLFDDELIYAKRLLGYLNLCVDTFK